MTMPLTFHCSTIATARNDVAKQIGIARSLLARGRISGVDECLRIALAHLDSISPALDRLQEEHAGTIETVKAARDLVDQAVHEIDLIEPPQEEWEREVLP